MDKTKLDALTLTSQSQKRTQKDGTIRYKQSRVTVKYDLKAQFGKCITVRELKEYQDTAVEMLAFDSSTHLMGLLSTCGCQKLPLRRPEK